MSNAGIEFLWSHEVVDILGDERVDGVRVMDTKTGAEQRLAVTGVFVAAGHTPDPRRSQ